VNNHSHAASSYRQAAARGATPVGQVVSLYDAILRDFFRALAALKAANVPDRVNHLNHAISVIGYLASVLDRERGGKVARQLGAVYTASIDMIVKANARATADKLEELIDMYAELRQAWYQLDQRAKRAGRDAP